MILYSGAALTNNGTLSNAGEIYNSGAITNEGTITNIGTLTIGWNGTLLNNGTLTIASGGELTNSGAITNEGTIDNQGTLTIEQGGTLTGSGTVIGVTYKVTGVKLDRTSLSITPGGTANINAIVEPEGATNKTVTWESSDTSVATVDANGKVTAVAESTATITVTTEDGGFTATCEITVTAKDYEVDTEVYSVTVNGSYASTTGAGSYSEGATVTINAGTRSGYTFD